MYRQDKDNIKDWKLYLFQKDQLGETEKQRICLQMKVRANTKSLQSASTTEGHYANKYPASFIMDAPHTHTHLAQWLRK